MESIQKRLDKARSNIKTGDKKYVAECEVLEKIYNCLSEEKPARSISFTEEETPYVNGLFLLTAKPVIYVANMSENDIENPMQNKFVKQVAETAKNENAEVIPLCVKIEEELSELDDEDRLLFMQDLKMAESGLNLLVKACYKLLGLISYLTAGEKETRAWTIEKGTKAPQAAGKIHSDFEKGFIRAEVIDTDMLLEYGNYNAAKEKGKVRLEGKDYVVKDGDVILFRFNV